MASSVDAYDLLDITAVARKLAHTRAVGSSVEEVVRCVHEMLYEGQVCPPGLIEAVRAALRET